jgi:hypothetical protein
MLITSMGIFGFLAKAHIDSTLDFGTNSVELKTLNTQQKIAEERLNYLLARAKDPSTASNRLDKQIQDTQKDLSEINKKRLPLLKEENKLVADVGPIKYVADMFFEGDGAIDKAVRVVIFTIMLVFDPLAVLLLIAGNISLKQRKDGGVVVKNGEIVGIVPDTDNKVEISKENITSINEKPHETNTDNKIDFPKEERIIIDEASGETIPPLRVQQAPGVYTEHHDDESKKKLQPRYDYEAEYAFKEKRDAGTF